MTDAPELLRHFPTREALLEGLLHASFGDLTTRASELEAAHMAEDALVSWVRDCVAWTTEYRGVTVLMAAAIEDPESALHASCVTLRAAGARLLTQAQAAGAARNDIDGDDLFAFIAMLAWVGDQPALAPRANRLVDLVTSAVLARADGLRRVRTKGLLERRRILDPGPHPRRAGGPGASPPFPHPGPGPSR